MSRPSLYQVISQSTPSDFVERTNLFQLLSSSSIFIFGVILFAVVSQLSDKETVFAMGLLVIGSILILWSLFRFFSKSKNLVYIPTGSATCEASLFFNLKDFSTLSQWLENGEFASDVPVSSERNGNLRLDVLFTKDRQFAALQLFQFVPYTYAPVTTVAYFKGDDAVSVCNFLASCRS